MKLINLLWQEVCFAEVMVTDWKGDRDRCQIGRSRETGRRLSEFVGSFSAKRFFRDRQYFMAKRLVCKDLSLAKIIREQFHYIARLGTLEKSIKLIRAVINLMTAIRSKSSYFGV